MPKKKKPTKKRQPKNPTDPNLLGRSVMEAFLGEPVTPKKTRKMQPARSKPPTIYREKKARVIKRKGAKSIATRPGQAKKKLSRRLSGVRHKR